jgi:uncharacterized protein involved in tolerance to divalent cations
MSNRVYYELKISAEDQEQANTILNSLLEKKLATGGQFFASPSRILWKGKVVDMNYITINSYTSDVKKDAVIEDVQKTTVEDFPMITFVALDHLNEELKMWINQTLENNKN